MIRRSGFPPALASFALFLLSACGGGDSTTDIPDQPEPPTAAGPQAKATLGAGGGQVGFSDGRFKLIVPAGALGASTAITVTELTGSDIPAELQGPGVDKAYQLEPDGLQFTKPARVEMHSTVLTPDSLPLDYFVSDSKGSLEVLDSIRATADSSGFTVSAQLNHFSSVSPFESEGVKVALLAQPSEAAVQQPFEVTLYVSHPEESLLGADFTWSLRPMPGTEVGSVDPTPMKLTAGNADLMERTASATCLQPGVGGATATMEGTMTSGYSLLSTAATPVSFSYDMEVYEACTAPPPPTLSGLTDVTVENGSSANESFSLDGTGTLTVTLTSSDQSVLPDANLLSVAGACSTAGKCEVLLVPTGEGTATVTVDVADAFGQHDTGTFKVTVVAGTAGAYTVSYGLQSPPGTATEMETITVIGPLLGSLSGNLLTMVSDGSGGYVIWDLPSGQVLRDSGPYSGGMTRGALPVSGSPVGPDAPAGVFVYRQGESDAVIDNYDPTTQQFTETHVPGLIVDATNAGGSLISTEMLLVAPAIGVESLGPLGDGTFGLTGRSIPASDIGGYGIRAAVEVDAGGAVLVGSAAPNVGVGPTNGTLYYIPGTGQALAVGPIGIEPRKMRCLPEHDLCAVTGNSDNSLTLIQWNGIDVPTILGPVTVGDGPVGLDLAGLDNGDVLIVTTGFNDNTYTLTEVASDGTVVSNTTQAVDAGCVAPVGVALFDDAQGKKAIVTCYYTYRLDVLPTAAPGS